MNCPDLHCHSTLSFDGHDSIEALAAKAESLGLPGLGITEHIEFEPRSKAHGWYDHSRIAAALASARAAHPGLRLWHGVEVGWDPRYEAEIRAFLGAHRHDYVLGALHAVDGLDVGPELFRGETFSSATRRYLRAATVAVRSGLFDILAHADLPKRYGWAHFHEPWDLAACSGELDGLLRAMVEGGTVLEANTSGLRQGPKESYPGLEAFARYKALGGRRVSLGSDAHHAQHLGLGFAETAQALRSLGLEPLLQPPR